MFPQKSFLMEKLNFLIAQIISNPLEMVSPENAFK